MQEEGIQEQAKRPRDSCSGQVDVLETVLRSGFARTPTSSLATACNMMEMAEPHEVGVAYRVSLAVFAATSTSAERKLDKGGSVDGVGVANRMVTTRFRTTPTTSKGKPDPTRRDDVGVLESVVGSVSA